MRPTSQIHELTEYQVRKFKRYFSFFDINEDGTIDWEDIQRLNEKILKWTRWQNHNRNCHILEDLHRNFFCCLVEETRSKDSPVKLTRDGHVGLDQWLTMWTNLTKGAKGMKDFPYWLQILPDLFFLIIDRNEDGAIDKDELRSFYQYFGMASDSALDKYTDKAYICMTANGDHRLDRDLYRLIFASFLLCRNVHGPGKYIMGVDDPLENQPFHIEDAAEDSYSDEECSLARARGHLPCVSVLPQVKNFFPSPQVIEG